MNTSTSPKVQYSYASGSANTIRSTGITYPNGRVITNDYGTSNGINDAISRVEAVKDGATALAQYSYLGGSAFVITDYTEPDIKWTLADLAGSNDPDTGDIYSGFDRFGRVKDNRWYNYGTSSDTDRIKYGYDRNGNRTYRENTVATANSAKFDEQYLYDLLDRLKHMDRGQLTALKDSITNKTFAQCWSLDPTGNWKKFLEDDNGDGTWSLNQTRWVAQVAALGYLCALAQEVITPASLKVRTSSGYRRPGRAQSDRTGATQRIQLAKRPIAGHCSGMITVDCVNAPASRYQTLSVPVTVICN